MVRHRKYKGGGFFDTIKGLFTRKAKAVPTVDPVLAPPSAVAPAPVTPAPVTPAPVTPAPVTAKPKSGFFNMFTRKRNQKTAVAPAVEPVKVAETSSPCLTNANVRPFLRDESFMEAYNRSLVFLYYKMKQQPIPANKKQLSVTEKNELKFAMHGFEGDFNKMAQNLFHQELNTFNAELADYEQHLPDRILNKGTNYQRCAFDVSRSLPRIYSLIIKNDRQLQYMADYSDNVCAVTEKGLAPVTNIKNKSTCVTIAKSQEELDNFPDEIKPASYMIIAPEFMPVDSPTPISVKANRLTALSFVLDAFKNNKVTTIEPTLSAALAREAPELLQLPFQKPVILITPQYLLDVDSTKGRFLVVHPNGLQRGRNVRNMKNFGNDELLNELFKRGDILLVDPQTAYDLRKYKPELWMENFDNDPNMELYSSLPPAAQVVIGFLQYTEALHKYASANVRNTNNVTRRRNMTRAVMDAARVYDQNIKDPRVAYSLFENLQDKDAFEWKALTELQVKVLGSASITSPIQIVNMFRKFIPGFLVKRGVGAFEEASTFNVRGLNNSSRGLRVKSMLARTRRNRRN